LLWSHADLLSASEVHSVPLRVLQEGGMGLRMTSIVGYSPTFGEKGNSPK
jgi:hypothetical protein